MLVSLLLVALLKLAVVLIIWLIICQLVPRSNVLLLCGGLRLVVKQDFFMIAYVMLKLVWLFLEISVLGIGVTLSGLRL